MCSSSPEFMGQLLDSLSLPDAHTVMLYVDPCAYCMQVLAPVLQQCADTVASKTMADQETINAVTDISFVASMKCGRDVLADMMTSSMRAVSS